MGYYYDDELLDKNKTWELSLLMGFEKNNVVKTYKLKDTDVLAVDNYAKVKLFKGFIDREHSIAYRISNEYGKVSNIIANFQNNVKEVTEKYMTDMSTTVRSLKGILSNFSNYWKGTFEDENENLVGSDLYNNVGYLSRKYVNDNLALFNGTDITIGELRVVANIYTPDEYEKMKNVIHFVLPRETGEKPLDSNLVATVSPETNRPIYTIFDENDKDENPNITDENAIVYYARPGFYLGSNESMLLGNTLNTKNTERPGLYQLRIGNNTYRNLCISNVEVEASHIKSTGCTSDGGRIVYPSLTTVSITLLPTEIVLVRQVLNDLKKALQERN